MNNGPSAGHNKRLDWNVDIVLWLYLLEIHCHCRVLTSSSQLHCVLCVLQRIHDQPSEDQDPTVTFCFPLAPSSTSECIPWWRFFLHTLRGVLRSPRSSEGDQDWSGS